MNLKHLFVGAKEEIYGLDIGSSSVKIVQIRRYDTGYKVIAAARTEIVREEGNSPASRIDTISAIRNCFRQTRTKAKYAICGLSGPDVAVRGFDISSPPANQLEDALISEAEQVCPFDIAHSVIDYQLIGLNPIKASTEVTQTSARGEKTTGLLAAATTVVIKRKLQLIRNATLRCVLIDVDGLALLNCFLGLEELQPGQAVAILNIGWSFTNLAVLQDGAMPIIRDIPYASKTIIDNFSTENSISRTKVYDILHSRQDMGQQTTDVRESLRRACEKLIVDVAKTLRYYMIQNGTGIDKVLVCGGFAQARGLIDLLNAELPTKVILWNPLQKVRFDTTVPDSESIRELGPSMAVATGLAMREI